MKKLIYIFVVGFVLLTDSAFSESLPPVAQYVKKILEQKKLLSDPKCTDYVYLPDGEPGIDVVDVVEKHSGSCHGDPQTAPRIFSIYIDQKTHKMESDINPDDRVNSTSAPFPPE